MTDEKDTVGQRAPGTLDERIGRWIEIAGRGGYGTLAPGDWRALETVLLDARIHSRAAAAEIERLKAEGTKRMNWIIGLIDHAKSLGTKYAAEWHHVQIDEG